MHLPAISRPCRMGLAASRLRRGHTSAERELEYYVQRSNHNLHIRATAARGVLLLEVLGVVAAGRFDPTVFPAEPLTALDEVPSRGARSGGATCLRSPQAAQMGASGGLSRVHRAQAHFAVSSSASASAPDPSGCAHCGGGARGAEPPGGAPADGGPTAVAGAGATKLSIEPRLRLISSKLSAPSSSMAPSPWTMYL